MPPIIVSSDDDSFDENNPVIWISANDLSSDELSSLGEYWNAVRVALDPEWSHHFSYTINDFEGTQIKGYRLEWDTSLIGEYGNAGDLDFDDFYEEL